VQGIALVAPYRQLEFYGSVAETVIVGVVLELEPLALRDVLPNEL
jgi:hypothetical protein